jgi:PAS domain S-box-containing protein
MTAEARYGKAATLTNSAALEMDGIERVPRERIEAVLLRSIGGCAIYALNAAGHVLTWSPGAESIKGYTAAEIIGQHFSTFYSPEAKACRKPDRDLLAATNGPIEREDWRLRKDGSWFWANTLVSPMYGSNGRLVGFACVATDATARRKAEDVRLRQAVAEVATRLRDEFVQHACQALDSTLLGVRVHLDSLNAAVQQETIDVKRGLANRVTLLEWGHHRLVEAVDRSLKIVSETKDKLEREFERPL